MIMAQEINLSKAHGLLDDLQKFAAQAAGEGMRVDELERELLSRLLELGLAVVSEYIGAAGDGDCGESIEHEGREMNRLPEPKERIYHSIFGKINFARYVYGTREKQKIEYIPFDAELGMPAGDQSYFLEELLQKLVVQLPYGESVRRLEDFLGIQISQRATQVMTHRVAAHCDSFRSAQPAPPAKDEEEILVVTLDGKGVPVRRPLDQRLREECGIKRAPWQSRVKYEKSSKRQQRGEPKSRKQMAYVGVVYSVAPFVRTADDVVDEVRRKACAAERPSPQNKKIWVEMTQILEGQVSDGQPRLFNQLADEVRGRLRRRRKHLVCVMDGQRSFRKLLLRFDQVTPILDIFHVLEWLWKAAHCLHPDGSLAAQKFVDHYLAMILEGKVGYAIGRLKRLRGELTKSKRTNLAKVITYLTNNRDYMKYDEYLRAGYPIGSGVVEGACRHAVKDRMEGSGMRWEAAGAQAVLHLRTIYLNGDWQTFMNHRIETEQTAQYGCAA